MAPPAKKLCGKKLSGNITPLLRTVKGKRVDASQVAEIVETLKDGHPLGNNSEHHTGTATSNMDTNTVVAGEEQQPQNNPRKTCRPGRGIGKDTSCAQTSAGQRRSVRQKKRSAIVLENDWLVAEEILTVHIAAVTKAAKDRHANFHNRIRNELPVRKLSLRIAWLKLTPTTA